MGNTKSFNLKGTHIDVPSDNSDNHNSEESSSTHIDIKSPRATNKNININNPSLDDWQKLSVFLKKYKNFSHSQMRWLLLHREENNLNQYIRKIGKPIYINVPGFLIWIENYSER